MRMCGKAIVMGVSSVYILAVGYWLLAVGNNHARVCQKIVMGVSSVYILAIGCWLLAVGNNHARVCQGNCHGCFICL